MTPHDFHCQIARTFETRYEVIRDLPSSASRPIELRDHQIESDRRCRFCNRGVPEATFKGEAHAYPDFLGNRSIFSMNECDGCNSEFGIGGGYEDHLGKWSMLARALAQIPRKKSGKPTFKSEDLRVETIGEGIHLHVPSPGSAGEALANGVPTEIALEGDTSSQPHIPIRAAKALVKIACSVCPTEELQQCQGAIDWLKGRKTTRLAPFPVLFAFTPGVAGDVLNGVKLLRRKGGGPEPYLWCVVQFRHFRLQTYVPFCPADRDWFREDAAFTLTYTHYPSPFGPDWPRGATTYSMADWSGEQPVRTTAEVSLHVEKLIGVTRPGQAAAPP